MKAATSTTKTKSRNDEEDDESREDYNEDDSNSVEVHGKSASKRNGKATSTNAAAASGIWMEISRKILSQISFLSGDADEDGDFDEDEDDEGSEEEDDGLFLCKENALL